jgi:hypothetical protein
MALCRLASQRCHLLGWRLAQVESYLFALAEYVKGQLSMLAFWNEGEEVFVLKGGVIC